MLAVKFTLSLGSDSQMELVAVHPELNLGRFYWGLDPSNRLSGNGLIPTELGNGRPVIT